MRKISSVRTFYKFCYLNKDVEKDPTGMIKTLKREQRLPEILTLKEMKQIVDNCPHTPEGMQNKLIIKILIATGARISETLNLEIKDVENQDYEFIKVLGKGSKYRIIPIYDSLENEIKNYLATYRPKLKNSSESFKIFPNTRREKFWKDLKTIAKNAKIVMLVKPQFEVGREKIGKNGVVENEEYHDEAIKKIISFSKECRYEVIGVEDSPIKGAKGNKEFLMLLTFS